MTDALRAVLVDDEPLARMRMRTLLSQAAVSVDVMGEFGDAVSAHRALKDWDAQGQQPDVLFLDIAMPGPDGLMLARHLSQARTSPAVVFVTAHPEHAVSAFEVEAVDYLTKPIRQERLDATLARLTKRRSAALNGEPNQVDVLVVHDHGALLRVPVRSVLYFKAEQKYVIARGADQSWVLDESLSDLEQRLGTRFIRIHRNALVARDAMSKLDRREDPSTGLDAWAVQIDATQEWLSVSRRQVALVKETMASRV